MWTIKNFEFNTIIITRNDQNPNYYIYIPKCNDDELVQKTANQYANELCEFLNGKIDIAPEWLHSFKLSENYKLSAKNGMSIYAVGPYISTNNNLIQWKQNNSKNFIQERKLLIDKLLNAIGYF